MTCLRGEYCASGLRLMLVAMGAVAILIVLCRFISPAAIVGDAVHYLDMASGVGAPPPYGLRILTPWLVSLLPIPPQKGFYVINITSLLLTAGLLGYWVHSYLGRREFGWLVLAVLSFMCSFGVVFHLIDPWLVDPVTYAFLVAQMIALAAHREIVFLILTIIAVLNRETALFLLPTWGLMRVAGQKSLMKSGQRLLPGLVPLGILVLLLLNASGGHSPQLAPLVKEMLRTKLHPIFLRKFMTEVWLSFGLFWLLALLDSWQGKRVYLPYLPFMFLVVAQLAVATDTRRLLFMLFPLVYGAAIRTLKGWNCSSTLKLSIWFAAVVSTALGSMGTLNQGVMSLPVLLNTVAGFLLVGYVVFSQRIAKEGL